MSDNKPYCIYCFEEYEELETAAFIYSGKSLCGEHYEEEKRKPVQ